MRSRRGITGARILWGITVVLAIGGLVLFLGHYPARFSANSLPPAANLALFGGALLIGVLGYLLTSRRSENPISWIMAGSAVAISAGAFLEHYAVRGVIASPGSLPGADWVAALLEVVGIFFWLPILALLYLFPTGRFSSRWWLVPAAAGGLGLLLLFVAGLLTPGLTMDGLGPPNPLGVPGARDLLATLGAVAWQLQGLSLIGGALSLVVRARRSRGDERRQLQWLTLSGSAVVFGSLLLLGGALLGELPPFLSHLAAWSVGAGLASVPVMAAIAILRYRLYDIDLVLNRTLVYGGLTILLGTAYVGLVAVARMVLPVGRGDLGVAVSTLAVAALFNPVRRRVQTGIDQLFYRRKYDAQRTIQAFTDRLRDEVELSTVVDELTVAARNTVQPVTATVWMRESETGL